MSRSKATIHIRTLLRSQLIAHLQLCRRHLPFGIGMPEDGKTPEVRQVSTSSSSTKLLRSFKAGQL
jgi:hypothetical protein